MCVQATCEVHAVLRETFRCKDGSGVGTNKNDLPEQLRWVVMRSCDNETVPCMCQDVAKKGVRSGATEFFFFFFI